MRKVLFILGQLNDADIDWLAKVGRKMRVSAQTTLIREGEPMETLYIVLDGLLSVTDVELGGQEIARLPAGEIIGEISLVDSRPPSATVTAITETILLAIPKQQLLAKLEQDVGFAARFYRAIAIFLADRLRNTVTRLGYGQTEALDESVIYQAELDDNVLDNVHLAGVRFKQILERLMVE